MSAPETAWVGALRRFGEIGPVYEIVELAEPGFVIIRLVESGSTARYPVDQVSQDPLA